MVPYENGWRYEWLEPSWCTDWRETHGFDKDDDELFLAGSDRRFDISVYRGRHIDHAIEPRSAWPGNTSMDTWSLFTICYLTRRQVWQAYLSWPCVDIQKPLHMRFGGARYATDWDDLVTTEMIVANWTIDITNTETKTNILIVL